MDRLLENIKAMGHVLENSFDGPWPFSKDLYEKEGGLRSGFPLMGEGGEPRSFLKRHKERSVLPLAVALSGGPDSLGLLLALHQLLDNKSFLHSFNGLVNPWVSIKLVALGVDHHLRSESTKELLWVKNQLKTYDIPFYILNWDHSLEKNPSGLMKKAREKRYELLSQACYHLGAPVLFLGHHQDDQYETVLMRKQENSHWRGLAGMAWISNYGGLILMRPFLNFLKREIQVFLNSMNQQWIRDPTNENLTFKRNLLRFQRHSGTIQEQQNLQKNFNGQEIGACTIKSIEEQKLFSLAESSGQGRNREVLNFNKNLDLYGVLYPEGHLRIQKEFWDNLGSDPWEWSIDYLIEHVVGRRGFLKKSQCKDLYEEIFSCQPLEKRKRSFYEKKCLKTLGGCCFFTCAKDFLWILRENRSLGEKDLQPITVKDSAEEMEKILECFSGGRVEQNREKQTLWAPYVWDQRFFCILPFSRKDLVCHPLGFEGAKEIFSSSEIQHTIVAMAWSTLPGFWQTKNGKKELLGVPWINTLGRFNRIGSKADAFSECIKNPDKNSFLSYKNPLFSQNYWQKNHFFMTPLKSFSHKVSWYGLKEYRGS